MKIRAYLDIETTGLSRNHSELTVVGIAIEKNQNFKTLQLHGRSITAKALQQTLSPVDEIYTYNGSRFDLPFIKAKLKVDLKADFNHRDLMYDCWKKDLKGGLKAVEKKLGINRELEDMDGFMAVQLWWDYVNNNNHCSLDTLLQYNQEDIVNLKVLREILNIE